MYDELIKRLRERSVFLFPHHGESRSYDADLMHEAADAIKELSHDYEKLAEDFNGAVELLHKREKPRWIPVTERLPEDRVPVLATYIGFCTGEKSSDLLAVRFEGMWCYWDGNPCSYDESKVKITHWMPLPEPPKEET